VNGQEIADLMGPSAALPILLIGVFPHMVATGKASPNQRIKLLLKISLVLFLVLVHQV